MKHNNVFEEKLKNTHDTITSISKPLRAVLIPIYEKHKGKETQNTDANVEFDDYYLNNYDQKDDLKKIETLRANLRVFNASIKPRNTDLDNIILELDHLKWKSP